MNKKIGRNDLCPCGSGKKYKNVVLTKIQIQTWVRTQPWIIRIKVRTPDSNLEFSQWTQLFENEKYIKVLRNVCHSYKVPFSFGIQEGGYIYENGEYARETSLVLTLIDVEKPL